MQEVKNLYNIHQDEDIYIIASGASTRVFPINFLHDKITIACNMAWRLFPHNFYPKYAITIHADLNIPQFINNDSNNENYNKIKWIVKKDRLSEILNAQQQKYIMSNDNFYYFNSKAWDNSAKEYDPSNAGRNTKWLLEADENNLYLWSSIAQSAVNLAANMGAKNIFLIGCDNCSINENHHGFLQHTRWKHVDPDYRYNQYYEGMREVRTFMQQRGINILSLTPFVGLEQFRKDFNYLCEEQNKEKILQAKEIPALKQKINLKKKIYKIYKNMQRKINAN